MKAPLLSLALCAAFLPAAIRASSSPPLSPDSAPTCYYPQPAAPSQPLPPAVMSSVPSVAWNGQDYGVTYLDSDSGSLYFQRYFADGSPAAAPVQLTTGLTNNSSKLAWNGAGYGVVYDKTDTGGSGYSQIYMLRLQPDGTPLDAEQRVSFFGQTVTASASSPSLAWSGTVYLASWADLRNSNSDIYLTILLPDGSVANGGLAHDIKLNGSSPTYTDFESQVAWLAGLHKFGVAFSSHNGTNYTVHMSLVAESGAFSSSFGWGPTGNSRQPVVADNGFTFLLAFVNDGGVGNYDLYTALPGQAGVNIAPAASTAWNPRLFWMGGEYGMFWTESASINHLRVSPGGAALSSVTQLAYTSGYFNAAYARNGFMLAANSFSAGQLLPVGCYYDNTPPGCAGNLLAYDITGSSATLAWSPAGDLESEIAYYRVYRNNAPIAATSNAYYNDSGLSLSATYNYMIQPVNAAQLQNTACTGSFYLKTNASLTLLMGKGGADALLNWTDAGFNNYNVFRGTSPQVMQQIGQTPALSTADPGALNAPVGYFYTVDDPGQ